MTIRKFQGHEQAQVRVYEYDDGSRNLVSYSTIICELDSNGWLHINGLYSMTTIKHIGWFMRELGLTYQTAKHLYRNNLMMNVFTGEIIGRV